MAKSTRHSKITGNFGELIILYWLSKRGFECAHVDHTGIDLIARRPDSDEMLGISVKTRSRPEARQGAGVDLEFADDKKIVNACTAFRCVPYVAVVVDQGSVVRGFLTTLGHVREMSVGQQWLMSPRSVARYTKDPRIEQFTLASQDAGWTTTA